MRKELLSEINDRMWPIVSTFSFFLSFFLWFTQDIWRKITQNDVKIWKAKKKFYRCV
jgi:hypothetical protein